MKNRVSDLPEGWLHTDVDRVGTVQLGLMKSPNRNTGAWRTKYIRAANIGADGLDLRDVLEMDFSPAERSMFALKPGDVLLAEASGSANQVGRAAIWGGQIPGCCFQKTVIRFRPHAVIPEYALLVFRALAISGVLAKAARGVGIQHLTAERFSRLGFPLPPLNEQRRISAEAEHRLIEIKKAESEMRSALSRIDEQNREIFASVVSGALLPRPLPTAVGRPTTSSVRDSQILVSDLQQEADAVNAARNEIPPSVRLSLHGLRLPAGWYWASISQIGETRLGKQLSPEQRNGPHLRKYLRVANVLENDFDLSDVKEMNFTAEEFAIYRLQSGDILLNEGQSLELVGRPALYQGEIPDACFQNTLIRFRAAPAILPEFALLVFRHYLHSGVFQSIARRSTNIAHLGLGRFLELPFPVPPFAEQQLITEEAKRRLSSSREQESAIRSALRGIEEMRREVTLGAVSGSLVPQDDADEPASELLKRMGPPPKPKRRAAATVDKIPVDAGEMPRVREVSAQTMDRTKRPLEEVLREAGGALRLPELFARAGYDRDSTESVERFYLTLRETLGVTVRAVGAVGDNALVEMIDEAQ